MFFKSYLWDSGSFSLSASVLVRVCHKQAQTCHWVATSHLWLVSVWPQATRVGGSSCNLCKDYEDSCKMLCLQTVKGGCSVFLSSQIFKLLLFLWLGKHDWWFGLPIYHPPSITYLKLPVNVIILWLFKLYNIFQFSERPWLCPEKCVGLTRTKWSGSYLHKAY